MTRIEIEHIEGYYHMIAVGHAEGERDEYNEDVVCNGLSCLIQTLAIAVEDKVKNFECDFNQAGYGEIEFIYDNPEVKTIIDTIEKGIKAMSDSYPNNIAII